MQHQASPAVACPSCQTLVRSQPRFPLSMNAMVAAIRFVFGVLAGFVMVALCLFVWLVPTWLALGFPACIGLLCVAFGDRFLIGFLRVFKWFA